MQPLLELLIAIALMCLVSLQPFFVPRSSLFTTYHTSIRLQIALKQVQLQSLQTNTPHFVFIQGEKVWVSKKGSHKRSLLFQCKNCTIFFWGFQKEKLVFYGKEKESINGTFQIFDKMGSCKIRVNKGGHFRLFCEKHLSSHPTVQLSRAP